jgi:hypothetical protein
MNHRDRVIRQHKETRGQLIVDFVCVVLVTALIFATFCSHL